MEVDKERRAASYKTTIREVNEGIERGQWPGDEDSPVGFRCECARPGCNLLAELTVREYEQIRSHPKRFMVVPGHEAPDIETVIATRPGYLIVEKRAEAGAAAEAGDPRD